MPTDQLVQLCDVHGDEGMNVAVAMKRRRGKER
jgi:hypothetical protein